MLANRLREVALFRAVEQDSGYVGTARIWEPAGTIMADVQPAENRLDVALYGERVADMLLLYVEKGASVRTGDGAFSLHENGEPAYRIAGVKEYPYHLVLTAEKGADG